MVDAVVVAELQRREHLAEVRACNIVAECTCRMRWVDRVAASTRGEPGASWPTSRRGGGNTERQGAAGRKVVGGLPTCVHEVVEELAALRKFEREQDHILRALGTLTRVLRAHGHVLQIEDVRVLERLHGLKGRGEVGTQGRGE